MKINIDINSILINIMNINDIDIEYEFNEEEIKKEIQNKIKSNIIWI